MFFSFWENEDIDAVLHILRQYTFVKIFYNCLNRITGL